MEKNNKGLIVTIVILAICLLGVSGYIVYDKVFADKNVDKVQDTNKDNASDKDSNNNIDNNQSEADVFSSNLNVMSRTEYFNDKKISVEELNNSLDKGNSDAVIVKNEIKTLLAYMSGAIQFNFSSNIDSSRLLPSCMYLNIYLGDAKHYSSNILDYISPNILECMYGFKYVHVEDNPFNGSYLMTNDDYLKMKNYFINIPTFTSSETLTLTSYDEMWKNQVEENEFFNEAKKYLNKGYRYAYAVGDGFGENSIFFENTGVTKKDNKYEVTIDVYDSSKKTGTGVLQVEVVDGHLKYGSLIINN